ncbi:MAG: hypothetical protein ACRDIA_06300, partial [Actinomycetota bacterium]
LEYDFNVASGADPTKIKMSFKGAVVSVNGSGDLVLRTPAGKLLHRRPVVYQQNGAGRRKIAAGYRVGKNAEVTFALGVYDHKMPLVIDPEISYLSFLGGAGYERVWDLTAPDDSGQVFVAGFTSSIDFPGGTKRRRHGDPSTNANGQTGDAFIARFDTTKSGDESLVYSAYLGGDYSDLATGIELDPEGNIYLIGDTEVTSATPQSKFPGLSSLTDLGGQQGCGDAPPAGAPSKVYGFLAKLSNDAAVLEYAKCVAGNFADGFNSLTAGGGLAVDSESHVYIAGRTAKQDFGTRNAAQAVHAGGLDGFLIKLSADASRVDYATLLGGAKDDKILNLVTAAGGEAYLSGTTQSDDFRVTGPGSFAGASDAFLTRISTNVDGPGSLAFSATVGGSFRDVGVAVATDSSGFGYVAGWTQSSDFPTTKNALQPETKIGAIGQNDGFLAKFDTRQPEQSEPVYSTYLASSANDTVGGLALDPAGSLYLTGMAGPDFPFKHPLQGPAQNLPVADSSAYVARLSDDGRQFVFNGYLGGNGYEEGRALDLDSAGNIYLAGDTSSSSIMPVRDAYQASYGGGSIDGFV